MAGLAVELLQNKEPAEQRKKSPKSIGPSRDRGHSDGEFSLLLDRETKWRVSEREREREREGGRNASVFYVWVSVSFVVTLGCLPPGCPKSL